MMAGLLVSLVVRRRRVWVRLTPAGPGTVSVELGGLARTDNSGWGDEFERLTQRLSPASGWAPRMRGEYPQDDVQREAEAHRA
jgi:cytochrome c biogenesis protein